jgi:hypothetical protein
MFMPNEKRRYLEGASLRIPREILRILSARNPLSTEIVTFPYISSLNDPGTITNRASMRKTRDVRPPLYTPPLPEAIESDQAPPIEIYSAYAADDIKIFKRIKEIYDVLKVQKYHVSFHEDEVTRNLAWQQKDHLETAGLIVLLISNAFLRTDFCYQERMHIAVERHHQEDCYIIPVLARPTLPQFLQRTPFHDLEFLPGKDQAISSLKQKDQAINSIGAYLLDRIARLEFYM